MMPNAWLMLAHGDNRMYGGNEGYDDFPRESYAYDSFVGNHRRIAEGDVAVVCDKDEVSSH